ncbi:hypothetical protein [Methanobrevibacter filiformis]|uniref:Uncharacterized protein n=1 Tax=Methanobrevibacter filiformis TaxID=55758 RepID=A0A166A868_9EURY|nr:hypothetical protein [Methanobrevibacter filiformis]KZX11702.1 hypothetical protein MBFIL_13470 [Methanobrevibacter filiformis]
MTNFKIIGLVVLIILAIFALYGIFNAPPEITQIGSQSIGYVDKVIYSHHPNASAKIAIITHMHSRENLSSNALEEVVRKSGLNDVEIVNYNVTVLESAQEFYQGRLNGEKLVRDYVVPDINNSDFDLVIIAHDHEKGYGDGFYIATPNMDPLSVNLAEKVKVNLPDFNYYQRSQTRNPTSTSILGVNKHIIDTGTPVFVYEAPEWLSYAEVFSKSDELVKAAIAIIQ